MDYSTVRDSDLLKLAADSDRSEDLRQSAAEELARRGVTVPVMSPHVTGRLATRLGWIAFALALYGFVTFYMAWSDAATPYSVSFSSDLAGAALVTTPIALIAYAIIRWQMRKPGYSPGIRISTAAKVAWGMWVGGAFLFACLWTFVNVSLTPGPGNNFLRYGAEDFTSGLILGVVLASPVALVAYVVGIRLSSREARRS